MGDLGNKRIVGVWIGQHRTNRQQNLRNSQSRRPLVSEDVQANGAIAVDIRMIDSRRKSNLGRLKGIVSREVYVQIENSACKGAVRLQKSQIIKD